MNTRSKIFLAAAVALLVGVVATSQIGAPSPEPITLAEFTRLPNGASYEAAVQAFGRPGEQISATKLGGLTTIMYAWKNSDGSNANAMFQGNKLITKAQYGLK